MPHASLSFVAGTFIKMLNLSNGDTCFVFFYLFRGMKRLGNKAPF